MIRARDSFLRATSEIVRWQAALLSHLERLPGISYYVRSRGWPFILSWAHRATGIILLLYLLVHVYTLSFLVEPEVFTAKMAFYNNYFFSFLEWAIAIPLVFHSFNGSRLILYELFYVRDDLTMIRWVATLGVIFMLLLGYLMNVRDQQATVEFFLLTTLIISFIAGYIIFRKVWMSRNHVLWKLQRISGALLLPMLLAHMLFMHINYPTGHDVDTITLRLQNYFTKGADIILMSLVTFHGAYGLYAIVGDYVKKSYFRKFSIIGTTIIMVVFWAIGVKLIIT